jgi:hypothetical protein
VKPKQFAAEKERLAKARLRKYARQIPDNETLLNILLGLEKPVRYNFYYKVKPHLRFDPIPLEAIP